MNDCVMDIVTLNLMVCKKSFKNEIHTKQNCI